MMGKRYRIAINGFGRIGRCVTRALLDPQPKTDVARNFDLVAINDLTDAPTLAHLLEFDSVHRRMGRHVEAKDGAIVVGPRGDKGESQTIQVFAKKDPAELPWKDLQVDLVMECTGLFRTREKAGKHQEAGARFVVISAPGEEGIDGTFCVGINTDALDPKKHQIISNASCTTNCLAPLAKVLQQKFGIQKGHMVTVHSYTNDQNLLDLPHKDLRRARAAALSMIPSSTGAAKAIGLVLPELKGKLDGTAIRVPTANVSLTCLTAHLSKKATREAVNQAFEEAAAGELKGILGVEKRPLVSSDFNGDTRSSILDAAQTQVMGDDLVEVQAWYDNEWGFSNRMLDLTQLVLERSS